MEILSLSYALLATQNALLGMITPNLRAVAIDLCKKPQVFYMHFYYDGKTSKKTIDLWQCATTEASAALGPDCFTDDEQKRLDYPKPIPFRGRCAYLRLESPHAKSSAYIDRKLVNFQKKIGFCVSLISGERISTNWGIVHRATDGDHILPARLQADEINITPNTYALLAIQRALLGRVTPALRAVTVNVPKGENLFYCRFYYDGQVSQEVIDLWGFGISEACADMGANYIWDTALERLDYPQNIPSHGDYAFARMEPLPQGA